MSVGQPPFVGTVQIWGSPDILEINAMVLPSGENDGDEHDPIFAIRATDATRSSARSVCAWAFGMKPQEASSVAHSIV